VKTLLAFAALCACLFPGLLASAQNSRQSGRSAATPAASGPARSSSGSAEEIQEGEKLFRIHCGRCHNPPEDLSPREARAVVRQMRVRAMLSAKEERLLLKFLAP